MSGARPPAPWPPRVLVVQSPSLLAGAVAGDQSALLLEYVADPVTALLALGDIAPQALVVPTDAHGVDLATLTRGVRAWHGLPVLVALADHPDAAGVAAEAVAAGSAGLLSTPLTTTEMARHLVRVLGSSAEGSRAAGRSRGTIEANGLTLDLDAMEVRSAAGHRVHMSSLQFACLQALARVAPSFLSTEQLADELGLPGQNHLDRTRRVIRRLRAHLTEAGLPPELVENVRHKGYRLRPL